MPGRRRARFWIVSVLGLAVVVGVAIGGVHRYRGGTARPAVVAYGSGTPMKGLAEGLRQGDTPRWPCSISAWGIPPRPRARR